MPKSIKFTGLLILFIITLFILCLLAIKLLGITHKGISFTGNSYKLVLIAGIWRYSLMGIFIVCYPTVIRLLYRKKSLKNEELKKLSKRWIAITICVGYELIVVHNVVGLLVKTLVGAF